MFLLKEITQKRMSLKVPCYTLNDDSETLEQLATIAKFDALNKNFERMCHIVVNIFHFNEGNLNIKERNGYKSVELTFSSI